MKPFQLQTLFLCVVAVLILSACSRRITQQESVIFPAPPDTARIQFLTSISSSKDVIKRSAFSQFIFGKSNPLQIGKPYGVAIHKGRIYVCDHNIAGLEVIGLEKKTFNYFIPQGKGQLKHPLNCYIDDRDNLYVADGERRQIVIFDSKGEYFGCIGGGEKFKPTDVFVYNNKVWVTSILENKIYVYDRDSVGKVLFTFPESSVGNDDFLYSPVNICVINDQVYVSDVGGFCVKIYDLDGKYKQTIGSYGKNIGQFSRNKGVAVDRDGNVYVVDAGFENAQIFNKDGNLLMAFGGPYTGPGYMWLPAKVIIDYDNLEYFRQYLDPAYNLKYLVLVTNQYGPDRLTIYGAIEPNPNYSATDDNTSNPKKTKKKALY